jgi:hypothetical protein
MLRDASLPFTWNDAANGSRSAHSGRSVLESETEMLFPFRFYARLWLTVCLLCLCCVAFAVPPKKTDKTAPGPQRHGRDVQVIDGEWKFQTDPEDTGMTHKWNEEISAKAVSIAVPALWTTQAAPGYTGAAWYWREFDVPADWKGQMIRLRFEGALEAARIWVNGGLLGEHKGGVTPFEFDATKAIHTGAKNLIAVRLEGNGKLGAGIWQGVQLLAHDEAYLADCYPQGDVYGHLNVAIIFRNTSANSGDATLDARVVAADAPTRDVKRTNQNLHLTPGDNQTNLLLTISGRQLTLWSPEKPALYLLQMVFRQGKDLLDTQETAFGFRTLGLQSGSVIINGATVKLAAIAPVFEHPIVIASTDDTERARELLRKLKARGITLVYLEAPPAGLVSLADHEGLLVVERARHDMPEPARLNELRALLLRDRAHPSIIAWDLGDVTEEQAAPVRRLDPTRFLLAGPSAAPRLWLPDQDSPMQGALPAGLLPQP